MKKWKAKLGRKVNNDSTDAPSQEPEPSVKATQITAAAPSLLAPTSSLGSVRTGGSTGVLDRGVDPSRSETQRSEISSFNAPVTLGAQRQGQQRSIDRRNDPLGLSVIYAPGFDDPTADIIFVHGLGGTSRMTWSHNRDVELFWPQMWLPDEPDICTARILSYGYNAYFASQGPNSIAGISDFAKQLLFAMKYHEDSSGEELGIGDRPIIFVVHSMGGLVFKKAFVQGHNDDEYKNLISQIKAVIFLSTPHRGTNLAESLNLILSVSIFDHTPKRYVSELKQNSPFIEDINEEFRKHAPGLQIFSFYETLETAVGPKNLIVVPKASSTLGYPGEVIQPLSADHHSVCKYPNRQDPNYRSLKGAIKGLVSGYRQKKILRQQEQGPAENEKLLSLLGSFSNPEADYASFLQLWTQGTCQGTLSSDEVLEWRDAASESRILWVHALPGSGKSVKSAVHIRDLKEGGFRCAYYFFRYGDIGRRSPGPFLRSLIYQIAQMSPAFQRQLISMKDNGVNVEKMPARMIWDKIFVGTLFKIESVQPIYIVVDAIDESDSVNMIVGFFGSIGASGMPLRVMVTSRKIPEISTAMGRVSPATLVAELPLSDNMDDVRLYVESEMEYMHGDIKFRQGIVEAVVSRAEGNFLWVSLAIKEILDCHSSEDIAQVLQEMPAGMEPLYARMESSIARITRASDLAIARSILSWATYCRRPLQFDELVRALPHDIPSIIDLRHTIAQLCGHFVVVDSNNSITLVHKTARDYLVKSATLPFEFGSEHVHENLFQSSIAVFSEQQTRQKLSQKGKLDGKDMPPFVIYAATSWAYHLGRSPASSDTSLTMLVQFLKSSAVLLWIRVLANLQLLKNLIAVSTTLRTFAATRRKFDSVIQPSKHRLTDLEVVEQWATDLLKIVGQFSGNLNDDPAAIQRVVPQFCPRKSAMYRQFGRQSQLSVKNISNDDWDDCLGRVPIERGNQALQIICSTRHLAISTAGGKIFLWDCETFEKFPPMDHGEFIFAMCFNSTGKFLASYGYMTTKVWNVDTGRAGHAIHNVPESRALCLKFAEDDKQLIVGLDSRTVAVSSYQETSHWSPINSGFLQEGVMGGYLNSPMSMAFTANSAFVAVGYRGSALEVWDMVEKTLLNKCKRRLGFEAGPHSDWTGVTRVVWRPSGEALLGIYTDGTVFKWNPFEEFDHQELEADTNYCPSEIQCSPDGLLFLLSDQDGSVRIYNYEHFSLIYKLSSEDTITDFCLSVDSRRFYDLRGSYCNIWEPNALLRLPDSDDRGSEADTDAASTIASNLASETFADTPVRVTALAPRSSGNLFCYGNEDGLVEVNDASRLNPQMTGNTTWEGAVEFLVWSEDANYVAFAEVDSVTVKEVVFEAGRAIWTVQTVLNLELDLKGGEIRQVLLPSKATSLLIADAQSVRIYDLASKDICAELESDGSQKWTSHPIVPNQLLAFSNDSVASYSSKTLEVISQWDINKPSATVPSGKEEKDSPPPYTYQKPRATLQKGARDSVYVDEVLISATKDYAIISISREGSIQKRWTEMKIISLSDLQNPDIQTLTPLSLSEDIGNAIERPLGIIGKDRLVFVDRSFWICSWCIGEGTESMQRHFFLPRDWVSAEMLGLCAVTADGTMLVPRKGEVAVIRSSLCSKGY